MTVRVRVNVSCGISSLPAPETKDLGNPKTEIVLDNEDDGGVYKTKVPPTTTNLAIDLPNLGHCHFVYIKTMPLVDTDAPVQLDFKINGTGATPIQVLAPSGAREGVLLMSIADLTSLFVTNASASVAMLVTVAAAGNT